MRKHIKPRETLPRHAFLILVALLMCLVVVVVLRPDGLQNSEEQLVDISIQHDTETCPASKPLALIVKNNSDSYVKSFGGRILGYDAPTQQFLMEYEDNPSQTFFKWIDKRGGEYRECLKMPHLFVVDKSRHGFVVADRWVRF